MNIVEDAAIFGAGKYGRTAYAFYKECFNITCYYDNDQTKWGTKLNKIPINNPIELKDKKNSNIIIAVGKQADDIMQQLRKDYKIDKIIIFSASEKYDIDISVLEKRPIFVVGDSHCIFWSGLEGIANQMNIKNEFGVINVVKGPDERFLALHMGPVLAYNINKNGTSVKFLEKWKYCVEKKIIVSGDVIVFSFGEIDIRTHVLKHINKNVTYMDVVDDIINQYMQFLIQSKKEGIKSWVWAPIASQKDDWCMNPIFPRVGNEVERNKATLYFSKKLKSECVKEGIGFLGIAEELIDNEYRTKAEYIVDECHLKQTARTLLNREIDRVHLCSEHI